MRGTMPIMYNNWDKTTLEYMQILSIVFQGKENAHIMHFDERCLEMFIPNTYVRLVAMI